MSALCVGQDAPRPSLLSHAIYKVEKECHAVTTAKKRSWEHSIHYKTFESLWWSWYFYNIHFPDVNSHTVLFRWPVAQTRTTNSYKCIFSMHLNFYPILCWITWNLFLMFFINAVKKCRFLCYFILLAVFVLQIVSQTLNPCNYPWSPIIVLCLIRSSYWSTS